MLRLPGQRREATEAALAWPLLLLALLPACRGEVAGQSVGTVRIAVAASFAGALSGLVRAFETASGHASVVSTGSTGQLYAQIRNGAPFDVFLAADVARPAALESDGLAVLGSRFSYAVGQLSLFSPTLAEVVDGPALLTTDRYQACAMGNPRTAPYGLAARQALTSLGMLEQVQDRIVTGANVAHAYQMVESGTAQLGLVSRSQVLARGAGYAWHVPEDLHEPLRHDAVLLSRAEHNPAALAFVAYLRSADARRVIAEWGYGSAVGVQEPPERAPPSGFEWGPILLTIRLAATTTAVLLLLGTPLAWWLARTRSRMRHVVGALCAMPLVMPPTVLGFYLLLVLGPDSPVGGFWEWVGGERLVFSFSGLVIGSVVYSLPFVVQPLQNAFGAIGTRPLEVAATLGATPRDRFFSVAVPMARAGFVTAATLGFAHTVGEFGVVLMIGGNVPGATQVVSIAIYDHVESMDYTQAHVLAASMMAFSFLTLLAVYSINNRREAGAA